jgi:glycosyltransferase involved in cell wall biosynthesis
MKAPIVNAQTMNAPAVEAAPLKIAVITPYYKTPPDIFRQCAESVQNQTYPCTHLVVADGPPYPDVAPAPDRMLVALPRSNGDYGNTPRAIGGILAESYGFDAVALLDDDNWFEPAHIETMAAAQRASNADLVACQRIFRHLDGSILSISEAAEDQLQHVDANCWLIMRRAFPLLANWRMPRFASFIGDRVFYQRARRERYRIAATGQRTVNYRTKYPSHYHQAGLAVPEGAYPPGKVAAEYAQLNAPGRVAELTEAVGFYPKLF